MFYKFMQPAVTIMKKLHFKYKILISISAIFLLLILPSRMIFVDYIEKDKIYTNQLIGLSYNMYMQNLIQSVQMHRGLINGYLSGNKNFKNKIIQNEKKISKRFLQLIEFDNKNLATLKHNKDFVDALGNMEIVKLNNISKSSLNKHIFDLHSAIVASLLKTVKELSSMTLFSVSDDMRVNYTAQILKEKLLLLEENTGQLRGLAVEYFSTNKITEEERSEILSIYTLVKSLERNILDNEILTQVDNYLKIQKETILATHKLDKMLYIINKNIIMSQKPEYNSKAFFKQATLVIEKEVGLYHTLCDNYKNLIDKLHANVSKEIFLSIVGFILIIVTALYLAVAFFISIASSLRELQSASKMIAEGKTKIHLRADTKDELGNAILAFNDMSKKLDENIFFLDGYKMAIDETSIVSKTNSKGIITYVNKKFCEISGYSESDLLGMPHNVIRHPDMPKSAFKDLWRTIKNKQIWHGIVKNKRKGGGFYIVDATIIPILDSDGEVVEYIAVRHDVTELENSKEEIKKQKIDLLTGLSNRSQLLDDIKVTKKPILFYLNIDDFASLNDFYGEKNGDDVLIHLSSILKEIASSTNSKLYKLHADEFLLLFEEGELNKNNHQHMLNEIISYVELQTIDCDSQSCVSITLSGGVAFYDSNDNYENLLSLAVMARKMAKINNKKFMLYDQNMQKESDYKSNIEWINKIKDAISQDRITTYFQPIIDNSNGTITKYESLVRMIDVDGKVISPFFFLDISKRAKLYTKITKIVIDKTFDTFENYPRYDFSVNITVEDINNEAIVEHIYNRLGKFSHPTRVIFEITESEEIDDYAFINTFIKKVKSMGARIAIDDFGSGYANFEHIINLDADFIKIDGSLIKNIDTDKHAQIITEAIIMFSKKLGSKTVVEFVHNQEIYEKVKSMGADFSQGFYLGEPSAKIINIKEAIINTES